MDTATRILTDTREPWPHPWAAHLPAATFEQCGLETGDLALAVNPCIVVERKTVSDFMGSITAGRDRFERELKRSRHLDYFCVIVEGSMYDCLADRGGMSMDSLLGTIAAFSRRWCQIHFAENERVAALLAWRILTQPVAEANKLAGAVAREGRAAGSAGNVETKSAATKKKRGPHVTPVKEDGSLLY